MRRYRFRGGQTGEPTTYNTHALALEVTAAAAAAGGRFPLTPNRCSPESNSNSSSVPQLPPRRHIGRRIDWHIRHWHICRRLKRKADKVNKADNYKDPASAPLRGGPHQKLGRQSRRPGVFGPKLDTIPSMLCSSFLFLLFFLLPFHWTIVDNFLS